MGLVKFMERIPIVGLFGEFVKGYVPLVDEYFYCELIPDIMVLVVSLITRFILNRRRAQTIGQAVTEQSINATQVVQYSYGIHAQSDAGHYNYSSLEPGMISET